jgi:hypothetical protein
MAGTVSRFIGAGVGFAREVDVSRVKVVDMSAGLAEGFDSIFVDIFIKRHKRHIMAEGLRYHLRVQDEQQGCPRAQ